MCLYERMNALLEAREARGENVNVRDGSALASGKRAVAHRASSLRMSL